jgi:hypothetical protein
MINYVLKQASVNTDRLICMYTSRALLGELKVLVEGRGVHGGRHGDPNPIPGES